MTAAAQLSIFDLPALAPPPAPVDPVMEKVIAADLAPNEYVLCLNRALTNPHHEALPSRLFRFPIEYVEPRRIGTGEGRLLLRHPDLSGHRFVIEVAERTGIMPEWDPEDEFGRDRGVLPRWWHAVDLCIDAHWRDLIATANYTDPNALFRSIGFGIEFNSLSVANARAMMAELGCTEPEDRCEALLLGSGLKPGKVEKGIAPNFHHDIAEECVWLAICAVEDGWVKRRGQHLWVTDETMKRRERAA